MVILSAAGITLIFSAAISGVEVTDAFTEYEYYESREVSSRLEHYQYILTQLATEYISEEYILSEEWLDLNAYQLDSEARDAFEYFAEAYSGPRLLENEYQDPLLMDAFIEAHPEFVEDEIKELVNQKVIKYHEYLSDLDQASILYYLKTNDVLLSNTEADKNIFMKHKVYYLFDREGRKASVLPWYYHYENQLSVKDDILYLAIEDQYLDPLAKSWERDKDILRIVLISIFGVSILWIIAVYHLFKNFDGETKWVIKDLYLEIILAVDFTLMGLSTIFVAASNLVPSLDTIIIFSITLSTITLYMLVQLIEHFKKYKYRKNILYVILSWSRRRLNNLIRKAPIMVRMIPTFKNAHDFKESLDYLEAIREGALDHSIEVKSRGLYGDLLFGIDTIREGLSVAVQNELKSERLKSELITNVSHDIRTPLTSIITYLDLLSKEDHRDKQEEYLSVLNQKVARLNVLIEDLFDAAKISSGNIPMHFESVDIKQLLMQVIGEHADHLQNRKLELVTNVDPIFVQADRKSIWRVIDNLIININKYALPSSRVYIDTQIEKGLCKITFRNISEHALNIDAEELKLRFKRGDSSRTSDGSGLGLAISEDLMRLQKGRLEILIDGDLFKAIMCIEVSEEIKHINELEDPIDETDENSVHSQEKMI